MTDLQIVADHVQQETLRQRRVEKEPGEDAKSRSDQVFELLWIVLSALMLFPQGRALVFNNFALILPTVFVALMALTAWHFANAFLEGMNEARQRSA